MSSIASLGRMVSGLTASQIGLQVTGHNLSNLNTPGYTRQQVLQHDSGYLNVGNNGQLQKVGLGVSITQIRQVRDVFLDKRFRTETSVLNFYQTKQDGINEIEAILDEPHGETLSGIMEDFWKQAQKLSTNPSGVEERLAFIQTADVLAKRANQIMQGLNDYQYHTNEEIKKTVHRINQITKDIKSINDVIQKAEVNGDEANDYRDQRNLLLDELSQYIDIDYKEMPDGSVIVNSQGRTLVDGPFVTQIDLALDPKGNGFVNPVWGDTREPLFKLNNEVNATSGGDNGKLQSLLIVRGNCVGGVDTDWDEIALNDNKSVDYDGNSYMIPKAQKQLAELVDRMMDMVNDVLDGGGINGGVGIPVFVPKPGNGILSQSQISNLSKTSINVLKDLPKALVGPAGEGRAEYTELIAAQKDAMDAYEAYLNDPAGSEALKKSYEEKLKVLEEKRGAYEKSIEGVDADKLLVNTRLDAHRTEEQKRIESYKKAFSGSNMQVNPELLSDGGYNHLGTVGKDPSNIGDNSKVTELLGAWSESRDWPEKKLGPDGKPITNATDPKYKKANFMDCYAEFVSDIGREGFQYQGKVGEKYTIVNNATNERLSMGGVSQDEELTNMLKYQYAYNASSRMINVLDGMMDTIINRI
ncbi:MAG: flagellar hook-associated protein FlgK [Cellulosilyticaceae bacterium]